MAVRGDADYANNRLWMVLSGARALMILSIVDPLEMELLGEDYRDIIEEIQITTGVEEPNASVYNLASTIIEASVVGDDESEHDMTFDPASATLRVHNRAHASALAFGAGLVHEARHLWDYPHVACDSGDLRCDPTKEGAVTFELMTLLSMYAGDERVQPWLGAYIQEAATRIDPLSKEDLMTIEVFVKL